MRRQQPRAARLFCPDPKSPAGPASAWPGRPGMPPGKGNLATAGGAPRSCPEPRLPPARPLPGSPPAARGAGPSPPARPSFRRGSCWLCVTEALRFQSQPCLLSFSKPALGRKAPYQDKSPPPPLPTRPAASHLPAPQPARALGGGGRRRLCRWLHLSRWWPR